MAHTTDRSRVLIDWQATSMLRRGYGLTGQITQLWVRLREVEVPASAASPLQIKEKIDTEWREVLP